MAQPHICSMLCGSHTAKAPLITLVAVMFMMLSASPALADPLAENGKTFFGQFTGSEPMMYNDLCSDDYPYDVIGPVQVTTTGTYYYGDLSIGYDVDMTLAVYQGSFDPSNPASNRVGAIPVMDDSGIVTLTSGVDYYLVVQFYCSHEPWTGQWQFALGGPGDITGDLPAAFYSGEFIGDEPKTYAYNDCEPETDHIYQVIGPIQVPSSGFYAYSDISIVYAVDMTLTIYRGSFDPANPDDNRIAAFDDEGATGLNSYVDYYFVIQPLCSDDTGEWRFALAAVPQSQPVPTLSQWGAIGLSLLLGVSALWLLRRKTWYNRSKS